MLFSYELFHKSGINSDAPFRKRTAVRAVIIQNDSICLVQVRATGEYKFPGGGVKENESFEDALRREVKEEIGGVVTYIGEEIGIITEYNRDDDGTYFKMDSHYYMAGIKDTLVQQDLDEYEKEYGFVFKKTTIEEALQKNQEIIKTCTPHTKWIERETYVFNRLYEAYGTGKRQQTDNLELRVPDRDGIKIVYTWKQTESHYEYFTCRPLRPAGTFEEYYDKTIVWLKDPLKRYFVLSEKETGKIIGEIKGFDLNERNHSMEFGYYIPEKNRAKGYGSVMLDLFLKKVFRELPLGLNKLYATTAENNEPLKHILEKAGFSLDGKNREHYWICGNRYDQYVYSILLKEWEALDILHGRKI
jgi:[ribosomal protein S5]-alanine N-acetyltransferase